MEKDIFCRHIQNPRRYTLSNKLDIQSEKTKYPYCSILQILDLMSDKAVSIYNWRERFFDRVAIRSLDNDLLESLLADVQETKIITEEDKRLKKQIEKAKKKEYGEVSDEDFDVIEAINSYQDVLSFKTAPKSVIIEKFLESEGNKNQKNQSNEALSIDELSKKSISEKDEVVTETLALIFEKQGKIDKAVDTYNKLIAKYPEKKSIFANRIEELNNKLENK
ncbi:MAG: tetratricopeptide repeat protein [Bacteroidales bacterium]|nr:tetratricopeptide repeat protein [Bacteroidales bacterium]